MIRPNEAILNAQSICSAQWGRARELGMLLRTNGCQEGIIKLKGEQRLGQLAEEHLQEASDSVRVDYGC